MSKAPAAGTFIDAVLSGHALADDVDDWVDHWHDAETGVPPELSAYLGMTGEEYALWVDQPQALRVIVAAHHIGVSAVKLLDTAGDYALAARAEEPSHVDQVWDWLVRTGQIDPDLGNRG
ncbi:hypothetical protein [Nocardia sp. AG03]|uniref:hypothetical protein n=1 Tax=Nocardia sp. AG03 TaxID=3025312 RepID=UPI0024182C7F|nr:hypothetical protein [Nocardia sp. AG03]